jgi:hypothetical protein
MTKLKEGKIIMVPSFGDVFTVTGFMPQVCILAVDNPQKRQYAHMHKYTDICAVLENVNS